MRLSLRLRLLIAVVVSVVTALVIADVVTYSSQHRFLIGRIDESLRSTRLPDRSDDDGPRRGPEPNVFVEGRAADGTVTNTTPATDPSGNPISPRLPKVISVPARTTDPRGPATFFTTTSRQPGGPRFRVKASTFPDGHQLIIATSLDEVDATLRRLLRVEVAVTLVAAALASLLGWWLVRFGLKPVQQVRRTAESIAEGDLHHRVPEVAGGDDIASLTRSFNTMLDRIQAAFGQRDASEARLRRFAADASHELRTPIAAVSAYAELFDRGASERPDDLRRSIHGIQRESARMRLLVEDLLLLARLDDDHAMGKPGATADQLVDLSVVVAEAVDAAEVVGPAWPIELQIAGPAPVTGNAVRLRQVIDNLLANVRAHTAHGTVAAVSVTSERGQVVVQVDDAGSGIAEADLVHIFDRFWRADPSRARSSGGSGLGLAIVEAVVRAHGGSVRAMRSPLGGARLEVRLPQSPPPPVRS